jgi:glycosyltransferase involved in cell wall biosynthesis
MRVLFVASSGTLGGAELALETYLAHLPSALEGHALVLGRGPLAGRLAARLRRPVAVAGLVGRPQPRAVAGFTRQLLQLLRDVRPDVVLATGLKAATLAAPACRAARVPLLWHKVDLSHDKWLARPLAALCTGVIPVGPTAGAAIPRRRRLPAVPPPVRLDPGFRVSEDRPPATLGSIGRLVPYKGHAHVIAAAARLRSRHPAIRVLIAGADDASAPGHRAVLRQTADALGMADRVELLGHADRIEGILERLTVLVQATYADERGFGLEGFGLALAEGSWAGLPVVGTSAEVIQDGRTGRLVAPGDVEGLAAAVAGYLEDPEAARSAGAAGAVWARSLRPEAVTADLVAALGAARRRTPYPSRACPSP